MGLFLKTKARAWTRLESRQDLATGTSSKTRTNFLRALTACSTISFFGFRAYARGFSLSLPSVSMHLRHINRNLSPSPEPVLQHRLAPLIVTNRTPSPLPSVGETFPSNQVPALSASAPEQQGVIAVRTSSPRLLAFVRDQGVFQDLIR